MTWGGRNAFMVLAFCKMFLYQPATPTISCSIRLINEWVANKSNFGLSSTFFVKLRIRNIHTNTHVIHCGFTHHLCTMSLKSSENPDSADSLGASPSTTTANISNSVSQEGYGNLPRASSVYKKKVVYSRLLKNPIDVGITTQSMGTRLLSDKKILWCQSLSILWKNSSWQHGTIWQAFYFVAV